MTWTSIFLALNTLHVLKVSRSTMNYRLTKEIHTYKQQKITIERERELQDQIIWIKKYREEREIHPQRGGFEREVKKEPNNL